MIRNFLTSLTAVSLLGAMSAPEAAGATPAAAKSPEKFALFVGIDDYPTSKLRGCVNDVKDMKNALVNQYKFKDDSVHIKMLLDREATRDGILAAFKQHLIENAKKHPNGIFVFDYSGHGSTTPDTNGDESDGTDETIVPIDSRSSGTDIVDDELAELFDELSKYTNNIVFILDSCHSGTVTRNLPSDDVTVRALPPDPRPQPPQKPLTTRGAKNDLGNGILPRDQKYVTLSGCQPDELSQETSFKLKDGSIKSNGRMTYHLLQAMNKLGSQSTFRELWADITRNVTTETASQHPQVEGDIDRVAFGTPGERTEPYLSITEVKDKQIKVNAGAAQGVTRGGTLAIYKQQARQLVGKANLICTAKIDGVDKFTSTASIPIVVPAETLQNAKVVVVTPNFGTKRLQVAVERPTPNSAEAGVAKRLQQEVERSPLLGLADSTADPMHTPSKNWDLAVVCADSVAGKPVTRGDAGERASTRSYMVVARDGSIICDLPANSSSAVDSLLSVLQNKAKQEALKSLKNSASPLNNSLDVSLIRLPGKDEAGSKEEKDDFSMGSPVFRIGERVRMMVKNKFSQPLYLTILSLGTSGSIRILYPPRGVAEAVQPNGQFALPVLTMSGPTGVEYFKFITTTKPVDFRFMEEAGAASRNIGSLEGSSVKGLLASAFGLEARDAVPEETAIDDWAAETFEFSIRAPKVIDSSADKTATKSNK